MQCLLLNISGIVLELLRNNRDRPVKPTGANCDEVRFRSADSAVAIAELEWHQAVAANRHQPGTISDADLERFRVATEVAQLDLARARDAAIFRRPLPHLQRQVEQLCEEVLQLRFRVETLSTRD